MGLVQRWHRGTLAVDARLIRDVENVLEADCMAPRGDVMALMRRVDAVRERGDDPEYDIDLARENERLADGCLLKPVEQASVYRLRGWNRARHGKMTVKAEHLSEVRNILDALDVGVDGLDCEGLLADLGEAGNLAGDPADARAEVEWIRRRIEANERCNRCTWCSYHLLAARIDAVLDSAGFAIRSAWIPTSDERGYDPEVVWRREYEGLPWRSAEPTKEAGA
jgi:hypothetical protein